MVHHRESREVVLHGGGLIDVGKAIVPYGCDTFEQVEEFLEQQD